MYLVPRGLERPCDLLIPKCSQVAEAMNRKQTAETILLPHPGTKSLASSGSITELQLGEIVVNEFTSRPKLHILFFTGNKYITYLIGYSY